MKTPATLGDKIGAVIIALAFIAIALQTPGAITRAACAAAVGDAHCASPETIAATRAAIDRLDVIASAQ